MPDKHTFDFVKTGRQYGNVVGCLVGFFGSIPLTITWFDMSMLLPVIATLLTIALCSSLLGILYGGISGYISGWLIKVITRFIFQEIKRQAVYKIAVGIVTFSVTLIIILMGQIWLSLDFELIFARSVSLAQLQAFALMSLVFAVYASQRVATDYLRELKFESTA